MDLHSQIAAHFQRHNAAPRPDFCGLSPDQMHGLLYDPLGAGCVVRLRPEVPDAVLDQVPFLRLTEEFLRLVQREGSVKLTPLGALPLKCLRELYGHGFILEHDIETGLMKLSREIDSLAITTLHSISTLAGLLRKVHGKLTLTKKGALLLLPAQRMALWQLVLNTFTSRFNWAFHDNYPSPMAGQSGWAYSVYLLAVFGQQAQPISFYAEKYQRAFPYVLADFAGATYSTPPEQLLNCYTVRTFDRALNWFGLIDVQHGRYYLDVHCSWVAASSLLPQLFEVWQTPEPPVL